MTAHIQESLAMDTFSSLTVTGPSKKNVAKQDADATRGCLRLLTGRLIEAPKKKLKGKKGRNTSTTQGATNSQQQQQQPEQQHPAPLLMMQITLKYHGATDIVKNWQLDSVPANLETLLLLGLPIDNNNVNDNRKDDDESSVWTDAASEWGHESMRSQAPGTPLGIQKVTLETISTTFTLDMGVLAVDGVGSKPPKLSRRKSTAATTEASSSSSSSSSTAATPTDNRILAHDRTKQVPLSNQADFLQQLGVTDSAGTGKPKQGMTSKLRQCQKFVEIVGRLVERCCLDASVNVNVNVNVNDSSAALDREISVVDMGCGRGYLTFSLHSFLQNKYGTTGNNGDDDDDDENSKNNRYKIRSRGIDVRPKLVHEISEIARSLGTPFADSLTFEVGTIADFLSASDDQERPTSSSSSSSLDVLIALHACDTATDDALWSGIARQANVIVVAPCCHKQVRSQLDVHASKNPQHPLADVLRHNIYRERLAETATDSIRALLLEIAGYNVQVFEFIGGEHTSKNVMITAVKQNEDRIQRSEKELLALRKRLQDLASLHGVREQKLAKWMGEILQEESNSTETPPVPVSARNMPPL
jgi:hypothetical protein